MQAKIISPRGSVRTRPIPPGFLFADLCAGSCGHCAGTGRRDYPMPDGHPKRNPAIPARACHDCNGTGEAHVWEASVIALALDRAAEPSPESHEAMRLFTPAPNQIPGQLGL